MEEFGSKIKVAPTSNSKLPNTPAPKGQEWCAITYLLVKEPKTTLYGKYKVLCFGHTSEEVEATIGTMFVNGTLERDLGFIQVVRTGVWRDLVVGGEKTDVTVRMNAVDGSIESEVFREKARRNAEAAKSLQSQFELIKAESEGKVTEKPYDEYCRWKTQVQMAIQREEQLEAEMKQVKQARGNAIVNIRRIEQQHGNFRLKFEKQNGPSPLPAELKKLEEEVPSEYTPPKPMILRNPREFDDVPLKKEDDSDEE